VTTEETQGLCWLSPGHLVFSTNGCLTGVSLYPSVWSSDRMHFSRMVNGRSGQMAWREACL